MLRLWFFLPSGVKLDRQHSQPRSGAVIQEIAGCKRRQSTRGAGVGCARCHEQMRCDSTSSVRCMLVPDCLFFLAV